MSVTIREIARQAGFARTTVSEVLNGKKNFCSQESRDRILETAKRLGYEPNIGFRIMTGRETHTAGIIFSQESTYWNEYNLPLAMLLLREFEKRSCSAYTAVMTRDTEQNRARLSELVRRGVSQFIFLGYPVGTPELCADLTEKKIRFTLFNAEGIDSCYGNIRIAWERVYRHYFQYFLNHDTPFCCLFSQKYFDRYCRKSLLELGLIPEQHLGTIPPPEMLQGDPMEGAFLLVQKKVTEVLAQNPKIRGWICGSDHAALGVVKALRKAGLPTEDAYGPLVCGLGNTRSARFSPVPIITADYKLPEVAARLMERLAEPEPGKLLWIPETVFPTNIKDER